MYPLHVTPKSEYYMQQLLHIPNSTNVVNPCSPKKRKPISDLSAYKTPPKKQKTSHRDGTLSNKRIEFGTPLTKKRKNVLSPTTDCYRKKTKSVIKKLRQLVEEFIYFEQKKGTDMTLALIGNMLGLHLETINKKGKVDRRNDLVSYLVKTSEHISIEGATITYIGPSIDDTTNTYDDAQTYLMSICSYYIKVAERRARQCSKFKLTSSLHKLEWSFLNQLIKFGILTRDENKCYYVVGDLSRNFIKKTPRKTISGTSKGMQRVIQVLNDMKIPFCREKRFLECKDKRQLPFDIYIQSLNAIFEFDGEQHFNAVSRWGGPAKLLKCQEHDKIKNEFCEKKAIHLLRIAYTENTLVKVKSIIEQFIDKMKSSPTHVFMKIGEPYS